MDLSSAIMNFFYNILPGIYFLILIKGNIQFNKFTLKYFFFDFTKLFNTNEIVIMIAFGLLLGFIFQGFTKVFRLIILDCLITKIAVKINRQVYSQALKILKKTYNINITGITDIHLIYLMDNSLNVKKTNILPTYFSSRTSLWANLAWATLILLFFYPSPGLTIFLIFSIIIFFSNLYSQQDTIIKSFVMNNND